MHDSATATPARRRASATFGVALVLAVVVTLAGCGGGSDPPTGSTGGGAGTTAAVVPGAGTTIDRAAQPGGGAAPLVGTIWVLVPASLGVPVPSGATLGVRFNADDKLEGRGVCNTMGGTYTTSGSSLVVTQLGATEVACVGNDTEAAFMAGLTAARTYEITGANLVLFDERGGARLRFEAADPATQAAG